MRVNPGKFLLLLVLAAGVILPLSSAALADSASIPSTVKPVPRIINGGPLISSTSSVVEIRGRDSGGTFLCSGSVIAPRAVLTASHCLARTASQMSVIINGRVFGVSRFRAPPNIRSDSSGLIHNDIAILFLNRPTAQAPIPLLLSRRPRAHDSIQILGYGLDEFGDIGFLQGGSSVISRVSTEFIVTIFTSLAQSNSCSGDSGGPAILSYTDGAGKRRSGIVGTISAGTSSRCWIGDRTYFINLQASNLVKFLTAQVHHLKVQ